MPKLEWIGKDKVVNHHLDVPLCSLKRRYVFGAGGDSYSYGDGAETDGVQDGTDVSDGGNMVIHGDNLLALKALLPKYEGRVKCIYIDPPYNTGNEKWVYNDNVNDPEILKWLGEVVGAEGEDLSRHDKWLCMMYPRLKLLRKLLSDDGAIFISIDDNEYANLKLICDEIFGASCFISNISWQRTYSTRNDSKGIVNEVEHILAYSKTSGWEPKKLPRTEKMDSKYKNPDNDLIPWKSTDAFAPGASTHQGMVYAVQHPFTGRHIYPSVGRCWPLSQDQVLDIMCEWTEYELKDIDDAKERARVCGIAPEEVRSDVKAIVLKKPLEEAKRDAEAIYKRGQWPHFYFTNKGFGGIARKTHLENLGGKLPTNLWLYEDAGHTDGAKKEIKSIFDGSTPFDTPKPSRLIEYLLTIAGDDKALILDSFAGSGTTAHAVLNMNKKDGGTRKFILIEMMDYAESITAERVKRVIEGYGEGKKKTEGTGGSFGYYELGEPLFIDSNINENADIDALREYIFYTETKKAPEMAENASDGGHHKNEKYYLGSAYGSAYYFYYEKGRETVLDRAFLSTIGIKAESYVIYADRSILSEDELGRFNITFKKIPRDIAKI